MKVTALRPQARDPERVSVYIDSTYSFSLNQPQLLAAQLFVGKELDEAELDRLRAESAYGKAYARALAFVMRRPRSEKELRDYAARKQWEPATAERIIAELRAKNYLNDETFAAAWARHRAVGKPKSARTLRQELRQKGVADEIIEKTLAETSEFDETAALKQLIEKKRGRYSDERKLIAYLTRQGFRYDDIKQALEEE